MSNKEIWNCGCEEHKPSIEACQCGCTEHNHKH